ncbi:MULTISPECIES: OmpW/AlkL family protein [unclassified Undibacterium]|uniref:OmpW/AlkL family protein n=1 Tax=unclassified Undibacterium TaxID=2630295 RepID=UPI002AC9484A|nr:MULTISPECIES: OmpW family outer membrane protein [unclassified Undibacterium]MEB0140616.1 OmpW family outer membrane protein [Undibacterium sp. CCC2.1]MEB0173478.1 OmpW family outer membrane protein [Undibacterium sp. CCC1.1]MEB0177620.1 OmpW family outer membrane protein [Undibacterium sp. CCC3.4]MEB0216794.1 OmpW family outer membrane protein [Undibacterium sp. 5I2]WPX44656.1 OmpW family outer membrane protein [Undibacterium sp. CCC3.4]
MKKIALALVLVATGLTATQAMADESPWLLRVRAVNIAPDNKSDPVGGVGAADRLSVSSKTIAEFDVSYFMTPNWSAELVLTYPQKHDVMLDGNNIGSFKHLPPTLLAQYHFMPEAKFSPYLGAGVNYTRISDVTLLNGAANLDNHSFGFALQAGVDYKIDKNWSLNFDIKKVQIRSDVTASVGGAKLSSVKIDPVLIGVGVGYRF